MTSSPLPKQVEEHGSRHAACSRGWPWWAWLIVAGGLGLSFVLESSWVAQVPIVCPFRLVTELPCPGCGLTRSFVAVAHGRWFEAATHHPFGPLAFVIIICLLLVKGLSMMARWDLDAAFASRVTRWSLRVMVAVWITWAVVRAGATLASRF